MATMMFAQRYGLSFAIMLHSDDDFSLSVFFFKIPESFSNFTQRVTSIDNWYDLSGFKEFFDKNQILLVLHQRSDKYFLALGL
jgi:hypothetical protein